MSRAFNFSAGPAAVPDAVLREAQAELLEWHGERASVMELSHRGAAFEAMAAESEQDLRDLLAIPDNYRVLFLQGGATQHFAQIPMNLAAQDQTADYIVTGAWGQKAVAEAAPYVRVHTAASSEAGGFRSIPPRTQWQLTDGAAYVHYTPNETIHGVEFFEIPDVGDAPLVADVSSMFLSRPLDVSRFGLLYGGAQKNVGASGLVIVIVRDDLLARQPRPMAKILNYRAHAEQHSLLNTPPTFAWYLAGRVFKWLKAQGGLAAIEEINRQKAALLYSAIDSSGGFYSNPVQRDCRSRMNVPFTLHDSSLDAPFLAESSAAGLLALKGHKMVGGMRASLYNAMPLDGVRALVAFMHDFARRHG
ncbi:3-phosphoserine/phosphohydroxythreonine transaminase [Chiayiivirga flava]|uniref:Phosphoserine aminotransferase n=1 Tax=Chiayiivirga flava TaxID=659595 RepID=A0A7W8D9J4_9GAMM|nr:3-phosphoserine/phosphohydroxythreonine transaminase [Chiayiivirga flava]MBB5208638.1 phosphoserine aminotransferase [Chiayiivirga flava]